MFRSALRYSLRPINQQLLRRFSYYEEIDLSKPCTVICKSGTVACWHPERLFPYEHSKSIDLKKTEKEKQSLGALTKEIEYITNLRGSIARTGPRNYILREIFSTGKHEWYTSAADAMWLGRVAYSDGLKQQHYYVEKLLASRKQESDSLKKTKRGGLITFHGPGQLVVYPIVDLHSLHVKGPDQNSTVVGVRRYVYLVEEAIIRTVRAFGLFGVDRSPNTGVWLANGMKKVAAIGINVRDGIVSHGLALNCNTNLDWFHQMAKLRSEAGLMEVPSLSEIVPCGLVGKEVTTLTQELGRNVSVNDVFPIFCEKFAEVFHLNVKICNPKKFCAED